MISSFFHAGEILNYRSINDIHRKRSILTLTKLTLTNPIGIMIKIFPNNYTKLRVFKNGFE